MPLTSVLVAFALRFRFGRERGNPLEHLDVDRVRGRDLSFRAASHSITMASGHCGGAGCRLAGCVHLHDDG